jgi:diadenosine tetraphosphate (Ap4A) HIT family hydrolase
VAAQKVFGTSSYLLLQKNGYEVGQTVPHVHFHYIPRKAGDSSTLVFLFKMFLANAKSPISPEEMENVTTQLKMAME